MKNCLELLNLFSLRAMRIQLFHMQIEMVNTKVKRELHFRKYNNGQINKHHRVPSKSWSAISCYIIDVSSPERLCRYCIVGDAAGCRLRPSQHWASVSGKGKKLSVDQKKELAIIPDIWFCGWHQEANWSRRRHSPPGSIVNEERPDLYSTGTSPGIWNYVRVGVAHKILETPQSPNYSFPLWTCFLKIWGLDFWLVHKTQA